MVAGKSKIKVPEDSGVSWWSASCFTDAVFSMHPHMAEGLRELFRASFIKALISSKGTLLSRPKPPPKASTYLQVIIALGIRIAHLSFGRRGNIQCIASAF